MASTWIVVAHRSGASLYERVADGSLACIRAIPHPEGRLKDHELVTDRPGRSHESASARRSAMGTDYQPSRAVAEGFARHLAATLSRARSEHAYERLVLVAEPRFLGLLRGALDPQTAATVVGSVPKELSLAPPAEIDARLARLIEG